MKPSEIVRSVRKGMGLNVRDFSLIVAKSTASGCSSSLVSHWETARLNMNYEKMFYIYTHAAAPQVREMASMVMQELNPVRWALDASNGNSTTLSIECNEITTANI